MRETELPNRQGTHPRQRVKLPFPVCLNLFRQTTTLLAVLMASVSLAGREARAAEAGTVKHEIKLNAHEGDRWDFDVTQKSSSKTEITVGGQPRAVEQALSSRRKGALEVLAVKDGQPTTVKVTFDKDSVTSANTGGVASDQPFPLAGKTVIIRRDEAGKVTSDAEGLDAATAQEVGRVLDPDTSLYPPHAVSVGDEWKADTAALAQQFQLGQGDQISIKCKLQGFGKVGGRPSAEISAAGSVSKNEQGIITHIDLSGVTQVDLATGQTLQSDILGKIGIKGSRDMQGPNGQPVSIQATGEGSLEVHQTVRPADALAAAHADAPPHTGSDFPAPGPAPAGHGDAGPFLGTFKDETLTAEFHEAGDGLAGTLTLKEKKLPVSAHVESGKLVGTFEASGSKFDFTASIDGNVMTLRSGSKTYTLRKPADNPLDPGSGEQPKPKNPLDVQ